jgi:hypothetical protein
MRRMVGALGAVLAFAAVFGCGSSSDPGQASSNGRNGGAGGAFVAMPTTTNTFVDSVVDPAHCLPRALELTDAGSVYCQVVEANPNGGCNCDAPGRSTLPDSELRAVQFEFAQYYQSACTLDSSGGCSNVCACSIDEEQGAAARACLTDTAAAAIDPSAPPGYCYVEDPSLPTLAACPAGQKHRLLFVSPSQTPTPAPGTQLFVACRG